MDKTKEQSKIELEERIDTLMLGILVESIGTPIAVDVFTGNEAKQALLRLIKDQQLALINKIEASLVDDRLPKEVGLDRAYFDGKNVAKRGVRETLSKLRKDI